MSDNSDKWWQKWIATAPNRWLGKRSLLRQTISGSGHGISYLRNLAKGNEVSRTAPVEVDPDVRPVLLIHGFLGTRGSMLPLEKRLEADGHAVFSFNLGTINYRDIRRSAFIVHRKVERILSQTKWEKIDIIGHSMGGLIGLYYIKKLGGHERVQKLVLMGSPVRGTWLAALGVLTMGLWSSSTWQMLPRSKFLDELSQGNLPPEVEVHTITAARDWVCAPSSTVLPGAKQTSVPYGHASLVISDAVYQNIHELLVGKKK